MAPFRLGAGLILCMWLTSAMAFAQQVEHRLPNATDDLKRQEAEELLRGKRQTLIQQPLQAPDLSDRQDLFFAPTPSNGLSCLYLETESWRMAVDGQTPVTERFPAVASRLNRIATDLAGVCIPAPDAPRLIRHIEARLRHVGYPLVQVTALRAAENNRTLQVSVLVPVIARITLETSDGQAAQDVDSLFGALSLGDVLNGFSMDQAIENVRASQGSDLLIRVQQHPGKPDELTVQALHQIGRRTAFRYEVSTSSSTEVHDLQSVVSVAGYRILAPTDDARLSLASSPHDFRGGTAQRSVAFDYNLAHGAWRWGLGVRHSIQRQYLIAGDQPIPYESVSRSVDFRADRVLHRTSSTVVRVKVAVGKRFTDAQLAGEAIEVQKRRLAQFTTGISWRLQTSSRYAEMDLAHVASPRWFGAQDDFPVMGLLQAGSPSFRRNYLLASIYTSATVGSISSQRLQHELYAQVQYSRRPQYASDQFQLGSPGTVRGFSGRVALSGEQGMLVRNDVGMPGCFIGGISCYATFDAGAVTRNLLSRKQEAGLASVSLGVKWARGPVYVDVAVARGIWQSNHLGPLAQKASVMGRVSVGL